MGRTVVRSPENKATAGAAGGRCCIRGCAEDATRVFQAHVGKIKVMVPLCPHHARVAFEPAS